MGYLTINKPDDIKMILQKNADLEDEEKEAKDLSDIVTMIYDDEKDRIISDPDEVKEFLENKSSANSGYIFTQDEEVPFYFYTDGEGETYCTDDVIDEESDLISTEKPVLDEKLKGAMGRMEYEQNKFSQLKSSDVKKSIINEEIRQAKEKFGLTDEDIADATEYMAEPKMRQVTKKKPEKLSFFEGLWDSVCSIFSKGSAKGIEYRRQLSEYEQETADVKAEYDREMTKYNKNNHAMNVKEMILDRERTYTSSAKYKEQNNNFRDAVRDSEKVQEFKGKEAEYNSKSMVHINALIDIRRNGFSTENIGPYFALLANTLKGQKINDNNISLFAQMIVLMPYATKGGDVSKLNENLPQMAEEVQTNPAYSGLLDHYRENAITENHTELLEKIKGAVKNQGAKMAENEVKRQQRELETNLQSGVITEDSAYDMAKLYYIQDTLKRGAKTKSMMTMRGKKQMADQAMGEAYRMVLENVTGDKSSEIDKIANSDAMKETIRDFKDKKLPLNAVMSSLAANIAQESIESKQSQKTKAESKSVPN